MSGSVSRFTNGLTQDQSWQPMGQIGVPDPFFYAYYEDDFIPYNSALYTATLDGGTAAQTAEATNINGRVTLSTAAVSTDFVGLQTLHGFLQYAAGQKMFYVTRVNIPAHATTTFIAGLIQTTVTPATVTDGIYFKYTAAGTTIQVLVVKSSTVIGTGTITLTPTDSQDLDLGFYVDRNGNVIAFAGHNLIGNKTVNPNSALAGPMCKIYAQGSSVTPTGTPVMTGTITTAVLNPTIAVIAASAAAAVLITDFQAAGQER